MKKIILFISIQLFSIHIFSIGYINDQVITIKKGNNYAYRISQNTYGYKKANEIQHRMIEFDIMFGDGTNYVLTGGDGEPDDKNFQKYWNKIITIAALENAGTYNKNCLRLGWYYDPTSKQIGLGLYAHFDHEILKGREATEITKVNRNEYIHVKMAYCEDFYYVNVNGKTIILYRNNPTWSNYGERTIFHLNAWFGDWRDLNDVFTDNPKYFDAPTDMKFHLKNISFDRESFWDRYEWQEGNSLGMINTVFNNNHIHSFKANKIETSLNNDQEWAASHRLPDDYKYGDVDYSFTVCEAGSQINFMANEVVLRTNTIFKKGCDVYVGPYTWLKNETIGNEPIEDESFRKIYSLPEINIYKFVPYPNPVVDILKIPNEFNQLINIEIVSQYGIILKKIESQENLIYIDFSQYKAGIYFIKVSANNEFITFKILKQ
jgi:hypothetical protein